MHLVSQVEGRLRRGEDAFSLLAATFPAGTVSGAPKVRAMQLISEIEGRAAASTAARSATSASTAPATRASPCARSSCATASRVLQAGAGIVADCDPASEHEECMNKIAALRAAIDLAETGRYGR